MKVKVSAEKEGPAMESIQVLPSTWVYQGWFLMPWVRDEFKATSPPLLWSHQSALRLVSCLVSCLSVSLCPLAILVSSIIIILAIFAIIVIIVIIVIFFILVILVIQVNRSIISISWWQRWRVTKSALTLPKLYGLTIACAFLKVASS